MTYIENIFICMVSPLLVAALCMGRRQLRFFLFCIAGMGVCLLSAYINTFLAAVCQADALAATAEIAPVVEEMMKLLPLVFYLLVFEPEGDKIKPAAITVALAFATFENVCYLIQNGADRFSFIFFRGFGTGAMHVLCGLIVGGGLAYTWQRTWLKIAGTVGCWARPSPSTPSTICSSPTAARRSMRPTPCRCCWWRRESCPLSAYRGENNRTFPP